MTKEEARRLLGRNEGMDLVRELRRRTFSPALESALGELRRMKAPAVDRARVQPHSRVLHGRILKLQGKESLRLLVEDHLRSDDCVRVLLLFEWLEERFQRESAGPAYDALWASLLRDPTARGACLLAIRERNPECRPHFRGPH